MSNQAKYDWELDEFRREYPLPLISEDEGKTVITGAFDLQRVCEGQEYHLEYSLRIEIQSGFPWSIPRVYELDQKISKKYHKLEGDALCLGAPLQVKQIIRQEPTVLAFFENIVVPYLVGHARHLQGETMPFGELDHGNPGLFDAYRDLFQLETNEEIARMFVFLASAPNRHERGCPCMCGSGKRFRQCHGVIIKEVAPDLTVEDYTLAIDLFRRQK